jgi:phosphoglycolate phosphatase
MSVRHVIFDLDGTLIDSAQGILSSFAGAFAACQMQPRRELNPAVVGPPLLETLADLAGTDDPATLQQLAEAFKAIYDDTGYRKTMVFPGVEAMLGSLAASGCQLYVATNKRCLPTSRIVKFLGWHQYFEGVYSLDAFTPALKSKAALLGELLNIHGIDLRSAVYVGDRHEDGEAAVANGIGFLLAEWGYDGKQLPAWKAVKAPDGIAEAIGYRDDAC